MSAGRTYWVTDAAGVEWRVRVAPAGEGWTVEVAREGEGSRAFELHEGTSPGRVWAGDRPVTFDWSAGKGATGRLLLDGIAHALEVVTEAEHRLIALGLAGPAAGGPCEVRAPMPGLVLRVEVADGASVEAGQGLFVIEAMKMENEIVAPAAGTVVALATAAGDAVETGTVLCRIDPAGGEEAS